MATPASGSIGMGHFHSEITRSSGQLSMSEIRTRYGGGSGAISFSSLRKAEGFTVNPGYYYSPGKPTIEINGYDTVLTTLGSISPIEASGKLQLGPTSLIDSMYSSGSNTENSGSLFMSAVSAGYEGTNITRVVTANTSRTITSSGSSGCNYTYQFPATGTIHCLVKF